MVKSHHPLRKAAILKIDFLFLFRSDSRVLLKFVLGQNSDLFKWWHHDNNRHLKN